MGVFLEPKNLEILFLNGLNILTFKYLPFIFFLFSGGSTFWRLGTYQNVPCRVRCLNTCLKCCKPTSSTSPDHESEIKHVSVLYNFNINQDHYWLIILNIYIIYGIILHIDFHINLIFLELHQALQAGDLQLGLRMFSEMRQKHVRPSAVTFSILVKVGESMGSR